jgi:hypothetical protein
MNRTLLASLAALVAVTTAFVAQQKSEEALAMIAALELVKGGQRGPFLLSPAAGGAARAQHDSVLLREISSVALRVTAPTPPFVLDTFVLSVQTPQKVSEGVYSVRSGGYLASMISGTCRVGGPSNTYEVRCAGGECKATLLMQAHGSGRCD